MERPLGNTGYTLRPLAPDDSDALQALLERCDDFFALIYGQPPGPAEAQSLLLALPEGKGYADKTLSGLCDAAGALVGVLDVLRDYPAAGIWYIGLLLLEPAQRGRGLGTAVCREVEAQARAAGAQHLRLAVAEANADAFRFWRRMGFDALEQRPPQAMGDKTHVLTVMQKQVAVP